MMGLHGPLVESRWRGRCNGNGQPLHRSPCLTHRAAVEEIAHGSRLDRTCRLAWSRPANKVWDCWLGPACLRWRGALGFAQKRTAKRSTEGRAGLANPKKRRRAGPEGGFSARAERARLSPE